MQARIFSPAKSAMQSGRARLRSWVLEFQSDRASVPDALMGWSGGGDTSKQVRLYFANQAEAVSYAEKHGLLYVVEASQSRTIKGKSYASNFAVDRKFPWTH